MSSGEANGNGTKTAVIYCRVSTDEQAKHGYSLRQQREALREYARYEGYEILEEIEDAGRSGASLERPGLDRVRDLVTAGDVDVVLAQDRDRFAREPAYLYLLREEFAERGTALRALSARGGDSPEGELTDGILDQLAKYERAKLARGSRRGKLRKAREGKIVATNKITYGFRYNEARDGYLVEDDHMAVVRRIFLMVGKEGMKMHSVKKTLQGEGVPTPNGGQYWAKKTIKGAILDDAYRPHTYDELEALVAEGVMSADVLGRLDPEKNYGVWWYNRRRTTHRTEKEIAPNGEVVYKKRQKVVFKPRSDWIAIPVPDSGVPREHVEAAREAIKDNFRPSKNGGRFWPLHGVMYCGGCGRRMLPDRRRKRPQDGYYHYYRCFSRLNIGPDACPAVKSRRAEEMEELVWWLVTGPMADPEELQNAVEQMMEGERARMPGDPGKALKHWLEELSKVERMSDGYLDQQAEGLITMDRLKEKLNGLKERRKTAEREIETLRGHEDRLEKLKRDARDLAEMFASGVLATYNDIEGEWETAPILSPHTDPEEREGVFPEQCHELYKKLRLRVVANPDGSIEVSILSGSAVCKPEPESTSWRSPASTSPFSRRWCTSCCASLPCRWRPGFRRP